jgi:hypothetical protein
MRSCYRFAPGLDMVVNGDPATCAHFDREYVTARVPEGEASLEVSFGRRFPPGGKRWVAGGHKTMRWRIALSDPNDETLHLWVRLGGRPRGFARSLVQSYFIEPLVSVAAARHDMVLLPAATFGGADGVTVIMGRSRSGKTTLSMQALAAGDSLIADDQVLLSPKGLCRGFPRRLRIHADLLRHSPQLAGRLPQAIRVRMRLHGLLRRLSGGAVAPPVLLSPQVFGRRPWAGSAPVRRVVLLERPLGASPGRFEPASRDQAVAFARELLREQRERLTEAGGAPWAEARDRVERQENSILAEAFDGAEFVRALAPSPLEPGTMEAFGRRLGVFDG